MSPDRFDSAAIRAATNNVNRRRFIAWMGSVAALSACSRSPLGSAAPYEPMSVSPGTRASDPWDLASDPTLDPSAPSVRDSGAVGDGVTDDTDAFARAIAALG